MKNINVIATGLMGKIYFLMFLVATCLNPLKAYAEKRLPPSDMIAHTYEQFKEVKMAALQCLQSPEVKSVLAERFEEIVQYYRNFDRPQMILGTTIFQKAYLAYWKLRKNCLGKYYAYIGKPYFLFPQFSRGFLNEDTPFLGTMADVMHRFRTFAFTHRELIRFGNSIYFGSAQCPGEDTEPEIEIVAKNWIFPYSKAASIDALAERKLNDFAASHHITAENIWDKGWPSSTDVHDWDNSEHEWHLTVHVFPQSESDATDLIFQPRAIHVFHEIEHVKRTLPGENDYRYSLFNDPRVLVDELGPTIAEIVLMDEIRKEVDGVSLETVMGYEGTSEVPASFPVEIGKQSLNLGAFTNYFRDLIAKYGSPEEALMSNEGLNWVKEHYSPCP